MPADQKAGIDVPGHRLHIFPQPGERTRLHTTEDFRVAPLLLTAAGKEGAVQERSRVLQPSQRLQHKSRREVPAGGGSRRREGRVGAREPEKQPLERILRGLEERLRNTERRRHPERIPVASGILHRDPALLSADAYGTPTL